jgi:hypothetical protein
VCSQVISLSFVTFSFFKIKKFLVIPEKAIIHNIIESGLIHTDGENIPTLAQEWIPRRRNITWRAVP